MASASATRLFEVSSAATEECLAELTRLTSRNVERSSCPLAARISHNVPIYDVTSLDITSSGSRDALMSELYSVLLHGPGVLVIKGMFAPSLLDRASVIFDRIIAREKASGNAKADHFSAGTNDRIWNSFSKLALEDPECFVEYFSNPLLALVCEAYLGPAYRITSQVNIVRPGGAAQTCHRDYHLGFQDPQIVQRWPKALHVASQLLTLQGAVAHTDMPLESGPTRLLPFSQLLEDGYLRYRDEGVQKFFLKRYIALPLEKGDALFFNPALFHAAGENKTSDFPRSANLLQVSSAFGRTMETIETLPLVAKTWDVLVAKHKTEGMSAAVVAFVQAVAEGNPFPVNLDRRPPAPGKHTPESEQALLLRGLEGGWNSEKIVEELRLMNEASRA